MARTTKVSIGMPVFNGEAYIKDALEAFLAQTFGDFALVISDNASTDATERICREYASEDPRIQYYRNPKNLGAAHNYNIVFERATGDYFKWAAHDDVCAMTFLESCVEVLEHRASVVLCYPRTLFIDEKGGPLEEYQDDLHLASAKPSERYQRYHARFSKKSRCNPLCGVIRKTALAKTALIGRYVASDQVLLGELCLQGKFHEIPEYLFFRRIHSQMSTLANHNLTEHTAWFSPEKRERTFFCRNWRLLYEYTVSLIRIPLSWPERARCFVVLARWTKKNWKRLALDLCPPAKQWLKTSKYPVDLRAVGTVLRKRQ
jgi:glycosyltransferase involved in cell wall biosynthesis